MNWLAKVIADLIYWSIADEVNEEAKRLHSEVIWTSEDDERVKKDIEGCMERGHAKFLAKSKGQKETKMKYSYRNN
jgi:hypothetical protein